MGLPIPGKLTNQSLCVMPLFLGGVARNWLGLPLVGVEERFTERKRETICFAQALLQVVTTWR